MISSSATEAEPTLETNSANIEGIHHNMAAGTGLAPSSAANASDPSEYKRLHITPFKPALLQAIIPPSMLPSAKNISYHSLQTFPEKAYGFIELPSVDAEKMKKKLNGSILKGAKIRIEEARPSKERPVMMGESTPKEPAERKEKVEKGSRKRKRHEEILPGVELRDRKVQRGWTTPATESKKSHKGSKDKKDKKDKKATLVRSKFTSQPECLFKTKLPANVAASLKEDPSLRRKVDIKSGAEVIVHEFSKSTKHATFLRASGVAAGSSVVSEYVEGKGWVDKDGKVVEAEVLNRQGSALITLSGAANAEEESSSAVSDTSEAEESAEDEVEDLKRKTPTPPKIREASVTSSSGSSSSSEDEEEATAETGDKEEANADSTSSSSDSSAPKSSPAFQPFRPITATTSKPPAPLHIQIPSIESTPVQIHPLEALYKKPREDAAAAQNTSTEPTPQSFSFFGNGDDNNNNEDIDPSLPRHPPSLSIPMTPFTKQDYEHRGLRSAAPTPDTAYPGGASGRSYAAWSGTSFQDDEDNDDNEDEEEGESGYIDSPSKLPPDTITTTDGAKALATNGASESDFSKWFYENRGEANRAWKKRRIGLWP